MSKIGGDNIFGQGSTESCQIKVTIDFADSNSGDSLILEQHPDIDQQLEV